MKKIKETLSFLKKQSTVAKHAITEIKLLCYAYYKTKENYVPAFKTTALLYPDKEVHIQHYEEICNIENADKYQVWYFSFHLECFGQNFHEINMYLENNFKWSSKCISIYRLFDDTEKMVIESNVTVKKFNYF